MNKVGVCKEKMLVEQNVWLIYLKKLYTGESIKADVMKRYQTKKSINFPRRKKNPIPAGLEPAIS